MSKWLLVQENKKYVIRRWIRVDKRKRRTERLPIHQYKHLRDDYKELKALVDRLNYHLEQINRIKKRIKFEHAFISDEFLNDYFSDYMSTQIPTKSDAISLFNYLKKYALNFFINNLELKNPLEWHKNQHIWGKYLLNNEENEDLKDNLRIFAKGDIKSAKVLRYIINELNRFMKYLHLQRPTEIPALKLEPLSKAALKKHEAIRKLRNNIRESKYIHQEHFEMIQKELERVGEPWRFCVYMAYYFGLRRTEAMGLTVEDVRGGYLAVERQFSKFENQEIVYGSLKNRKPRKVPYILLGKEEAYEHISMLFKDKEGEVKPIHPDTITQKFSKLMEDLKLPSYIFGT